MPWRAATQAFKPGSAVGRSPGKDLDSESFRSLVLTHADRVQRVLWAILGDRTLAAEASIEAFAKGNRRIGECSEPWLEVLKLALAECRQLRWRVAITAVCTFFLARSHDKRTIALRLLQRLSWQDRVLLALREVGGLSLKQVAYVLGRAESDVRSDLFTARQHLLQVAKG